MLKIKDGISLKELEKFGFYINTDGDYEFDVEDNRSNLVVCVNDYTDAIKGQIFLITGCYGDYPQDVFSEQLNILYDLIKSDVVEKVVENG